MTTTFRRLGPWWRVWPDVLAHKLADHGLLGHRVVAAACSWRGPHRSRHWI